MKYIIYLRDGSEIEIQSTKQFSELEQQVRSLYEDNFVRLETA
jgi:hypothetical protein